MNPTPRIVVGVDAVVAIAAIVGTRSDVAAMSTSMPRSGSLGCAADRDRSARRTSTSQPIAASSSTIGDVALQRGRA